MFALTNQSESPDGASRTGHVCYGENHTQTNNKLRQERHSRSSRHPGVNAAQKMSLLTELGKSFSSNFYKYAAPTALIPMAAMQTAIKNETCSSPNQPEAQVKTVK